MVPLRGTMPHAATDDDVADLRAEVCELRRRVELVEAGMLFDFRDSLAVPGTWRRMKDACSWWLEWFDAVEGEGGPHGNDEG